MTYIKDPKAIEEKSFEIILSEMKNTQLDPLRLKVIQRVIHTTTDFDYEEILQFKEGVLETLITAFKRGCHLIADTKMIKAGINKTLLQQLKLPLHCFISDEETFKLAKEQAITRSMAAVDRALSLKGPKVFIVGNAPTALFRLIEDERMMTDVVGVIGVPVGFVGAAEAKEALWQKEVPSIITRGRKGGSTVAVAIIHALLKEAVKANEK